MPNYCSNSVRFIGSPGAVKEVRQLFSEIEDKQARSNRYHLLDFVRGGTGYMEDIAVGPDWITYESRWVPNIGLV